MCQRNARTTPLYFLAAAGLPAGEPAGLAAGLAAGEPLGLAAGLAQAAEGEDSPCKRRGEKQERNGWSKLDRRCDQRSTFAKGITFKALLLNAINTYT